MKKLLCLLSASLVMLAGCSKDDAAPAIPMSSAVLVKKTIDTEDGVKTTTLYSYNGNKVVSATSDDDYLTLYTYTGDLITQMKGYEGTTLFQTENFEYDANGLLKTYVILLNTQDYGAKEVYVHNSNNTISITRTLGNLVSQTENLTTSKLFLTNGEISKAEYYNTGSPTDVINLTYDTKNNPFKNITGFSKISFSGKEIYGFNYNILSSKDPDDSSNDVTYTYTYNSDGYPTLEKEDDGSAYKREYFY